MKRYQGGKTNILTTLRWRSLVVLALIICSGVTLSIFMYAAISKWEQNGIRDEFEAAAKDRVLIIQKRIDLYLFSLESFYSFHIHGEDVTRKEFQTFAGSLLKQLPGVQAAEWIPLVPHSQRKLFEEMAHKDGFADFQITERQSQGKMVPAGERNEYFPVYFVEPYQGNASVLGFDLASNPSRLEAMEKARDTGKAVATAPVTLVQETGSQRGILVFKPVYEKNRPTDTVEDRRNNLKGFVLMVFRIGDVVENALAYFEPRGLDICISDVTGSQEELLYLHSSRKRETPLKFEDPNETLRKTTLQYTGVITVANRNWSIKVLPAPDFIITAGEKWHPLGFLITGFVFTAFLTGYILLIMLGNIRTRKYASQLLTANNKLENDITERKKAEDALLKNLTLYEGLIETTDTGFVILDQKGRILDANQEYVRLSGHENLSQIRGRSVVEWTADYEKEKNAEAVGRCFREGQIRNLKIDYVNAQGKITPIEINATVVKVDGAPQILTLCRDITERKRAEEKLERVAKEWTSTFDSITDLISIQDKDFRYIRVNKSFANTFRMKPEEIVGKTCYKLIHGTREPWPTCPHKRALDDGKAHREEFFEPKLGIHIEVSVSPLIDEKGEVVGTVHITKNITERKRAEEALRESEERYKNLFKANADGILIADVTTKKFRYANPAICRMLGYSEEEFTRMSVADIHPKESLKQVFAEFEAQASGAKINAELPCVRKDGQIISVSINAGTVTIGQTEYLMGIFRDITERKQAEQELQRLNAELEEANQEMKNFVYIASHDMREPLRKITAFGAILQQSLKDKLSSDDAENLHFMIDGAERMAKMIEGLLVYARVSTKAQSAQAVDLNEIVKQLQQFEISVLLEEKHATIEIPQPLPCVEVDPVQIRQLMQNLIANGVKYQKKGNAPHITITSKPAADGMVRIEVTDNGIGIAPEYQQSIFTMFRRLHSRDEYEGTGIGLAVCKKIVERHGGKISVESEPDKGSTFWFTIQTAEKPAVAAAEVESHV